MTGLLLGLRVQHWPNITPKITLPLHLVFLVNRGSIDMIVKAYAGVSEILILSILIRIPMPLWTQHIVLYL